MVSSNVEVGAYATVDGVLSVLRTMPRLRPDGSMGDFSYEASMEYWEAVENTFQSWRLPLLLKYTVHQKHVMTFCERFLNRVEST